MLFMSPILEGLRSRTNWRGRPHRLSSGTLFCALWKIKWEGRGIGLIEGYSYRAMLCPMDFPLSRYQQAAIVRAWGSKAGTGLFGEAPPSVALVSLPQWQYTPGCIGCMRAQCLAWH